MFGIPRSRSQIHLIDYFVSGISAFIRTRTLAAFLFLFRGVRMVIVRTRTCRGTSRGWKTSVPSMISATVSLMISMTFSFPVVWLRKLVVKSTPVVW